MLKKVNGKLIAVIVCLLLAIATSTRGECEIVRKPVESSALSSAGYDAVNHVLEIEFRKNGYIYQYSNIPEEEYIGLINAESIGRYYNRRIKGKYPSYRKWPPRY